ncbi:hypothetical protein [Helicobacter pylori]|uniref:hypothetical protein n=1 Tax=Helicobacter pylori TaxID=210 RepID=UPI000EB52E63|nr:hypothetical protein [Helicobacter pylori]
MKTARYCLELLNLGGLLRQGEYLGETNRALRYLIEGYSKQYFLAKVFNIKLFSHEKCNIFLSLQINCSKNTLLSIKQKS